MNSSNQTDAGRFNLKTLLICLITVVSLLWIGDLAKKGVSKTVLSGQPEKIAYEDYLFASAVAEKDFQEKHPKIGKLYELQEQSSIALLKKSKQLIVDKLNSLTQEGYPLTRLRLVKFCLGEDVFDTAGAEKTAAPEDLLLSNNMGLALTNPQSKAGVNEEEIAKAFPDDCMRHYFWRAYFEKNNQPEAAKKETELLRSSISSIQRHVVNVIIADAFTVSIGLILFFALLLRKKLSLSEEEAAGDAAANLIYPKPKSVLYSLASVIYVLVCGSLLCSAIESFLKWFLPLSTACAIRFLLIYPVELILIYFFAIKQQGLSLFQGISLRPTATRSEAKQLILCGLAAFFVLSFLSNILLWIEMYLPSPIVEDSSLDVLAISVNRSIAIPILIVVTILAPFVEEAMCRGYLYRSLRTKTSQVTAILLTAALFSASHLHLNPYTAVHHFLMGLVTVFVFIKTKSLIPSIICHSIWNATISISLVTALCQYYSVNKILF